MKLIKIKNNNWLSPDEVYYKGKMVKIFFKKIKKKKVKVGPSESMSKSKKNTIDPENIIKSIMELMQLDFYFI